MYVDNNKASTRQQINTNFAKEMSCSSRLLY